MLTIKKEEEIRNLIKKGFAGRKIERLSGVDHSAVENIRKICEVAQSLPRTQLSEIKSMLMSGLSISAIESKMQVPRYVVRSVRRFFYLYRREAGWRKPHECPTCGAISLPHIDAGDESVRITIPPSTSISKEAAASLCQIVVDLLELDKLQLIPNPLFYYLARRAEKTLEKINGENKKAKAA